MNNQRVTILHGTDGKWHLFDALHRKAIDLEPFDSRHDAEAARVSWLRDMRQLALDEASEAIAFI